MNTMIWPHYRDEINHETYQNTSTRRAFPLKTSSQMSLSKRGEFINVDVLVKLSELFVWSFRVYFTFLCGACIKEPIGTEPNLSWPTL